LELFSFKLSIQEKLHKALLLEDVLSILPEEGKEEVRKEDQEDLEVTQEKVVMVVMAAKVDMEVKEKVKEASEVDLVDHSELMLTP
jgi:hypothetical protein